MNRILPKNKKLTGKQLTLYRINIVKNYTYYI